LFAAFRILVVIVVAAIAFIIPNIHILLTFCGAILGTIVNIVIPVLFYNKAYAWTPKNRKLVKKKDDEEPLMD